MAGTGTGCENNSRDEAGCVRAAAKTTVRAENRLNYKRTNDMSQTATRAFSLASHALGFGSSSSTFCLLTPV